MRNIPVSLFVIDTVSAPRSLAAVDFSTRFCTFEEVIFLTDTRKFPNLKLIPFSTDVDVPFEGQLRPMRVIHHEESDRKVRTKSGLANLPIDYELAVMREPAKYVKTSHYLHLEWDSAVLDPYAWDHQWLQWDYIGAIWPPHYEHGFPPCDGRTNAVGNAGFSLQSVHYSEAVTDMIRVFKDDPDMISSDMYPCRTKRKWLESKHGIRFAPVEVAWKFSCENRIYSGQFGFHGRWTAQMNNWTGPFFGPIRPA